MTGPDGLPSREPRAASRDNGRAWPEVIPLTGLAPEELLQLTWDQARRTDAAHGGFTDDR